MSPSPGDFPVERLLSWYEDHGRHDLPWRAADRTPFEVLVAEILLQQTTVAAVTGRYPAIVARYPTPAAAAAAPVEDLTAAVAPLGLEKRGEYVQRSAAGILARHGGDVPADRDALLSLHGVGEYTADAVRALCWDEPVCGVDANVERVLTRYFALDGEDVDAAADALVPDGRGGEFLPALLDFGAEVCTARSPDCAGCPLADDCAFAGTVAPGESTTG